MVHMATGNEAVRWPVENALRLSRPVTKTLMQEQTLRMDYYPTLVDRQVVITGRAADIEKVIQKAAGREMKVNGEGPISVQTQPYAKMRVDDFFPPELASRFSGLENYSGIEVHLYDITAPDGVKETEAMVLEVIKNIYHIAAEEEELCLVFADPNLITGNPNTGGTGGVSGGPLGATEIIDERFKDAKSVFLDHWAFGGPDPTNEKLGWGINLEHRREGGMVSQNAPKVSRERQVTETGDGTRVFILDSFPSEVDPTHQDDIEMAVSCLEPVVQIQCRSVERDMEIHGTYVAGLLNRVAPCASLHLVKILNEEAKGEVFTLTAALAAVGAYALKGPSDTVRSLNDVVINLSLEADISEDQIVEQGVRGAIQALWKRVEPDFNENDVMHGLLKDMIYSFAYIPCVRLSVKILHLLGAVVVASAGNDSASVYGHLPMGIPARYPEVIGVAASNHLGNLASFSNSANLMAPGGGPEEAESPVTEISELAGQVDDLSWYVMASIVPNVNSSYESGWAYWWGTSFAAPLVSGLAALVQQAYMKDMKEGKALPEPAEIANLIRENANRGVIDVQATLQAIHGSAHQMQV